MAAPAVAAAVKAAVAVLSNEKTRKAVGWIIVAILSPVILLIVVIVSLLGGTSQHNNAAVELSFNGGVISSSTPADYAGHIHAMQDCFVMLDIAVADVQARIEDDAELDAIRVKSVFYSLYFGTSPLGLSPERARAFADCFVTYETRTRLVESEPDENGETTTVEEEYTVAVPVTLGTAYAQLAAAGMGVNSDQRSNASSVYVLIKGETGFYGGTIEFGGDRSVELDVSQFTDRYTKNNRDLVTYANHAFASGWGYVWGTYGSILTESLLNYKVEQYPEGVGDKEEFIRATWLGGRTTDCVGLIKGYGWLDPDTLVIGYAANGMPDISANQMYNAATVKGSMDTMPDTPGLAVWKDGHIGVYIGNGEVIEAMGTKYGVVKTQLSERRWTAWLEVPYINYD